MKKPILVYLSLFNLIYFIYLFRISQFHMQYKRNIEDKRVQYEI